MTAQRDRFLEEKKLQHRTFAESLQEVAIRVEMPMDLVRDVVVTFLNVFLESLLATTHSAFVGKRRFIMPAVGVFTVALKPARYMKETVLRWDPERGRHLFRLGEGMVLMPERFSMLFHVTEILAEALNVGMAPPIQADEG